MADFKGVALFTVPKDAIPSERFRGRFNDVAKDLKVGLEWASDKQNPLAVDASELKVAADSLQKYNLQSATPQIFNDALLADVKKVLAEVEKRRLESVETSALFHKRIVYRAPLELLNKAEREAVKLFAEEVEPRLTWIEVHQDDPHAGEEGAWLYLHGDYYSKIMFERFQHDACAGAPYLKDKKACSLLPFFPDRPPINGFIDPKISLEEWRGLSKRFPTDHEILRPSTVVTKDGDEYKTTPLPLVSEFREDHLKMAAALEKIAALNVEGDRIGPKTQDQLRKWAQFFRTGSAKDEAAAVQATIDAGEETNNLRVHLGPSESYWADNNKFPYLLQVGIRDPEIGKILSKSKNRFPLLEASLSTIPNYKPRSVSLRGGFADTIYQALTGGFIKTFHITEPMGNNFPNYTYPGVEGSNRFILLEAVGSSSELMKLAMSRLLDEDISDWDARKYLAMETAQHESGHLLGPQRDHVTPSDNRMGAIFGEHWGSADEPKADLTGVANVKIALERGEMTKEEARDTLRAVVGMHLSKRYKGKANFEGSSDHDFGHLLETGWYLKTGVFSLVNVSGPDGKAQRKVHVDYDKMVEEGFKLWKIIMTYQAAGDLNGYLQFAKEQVAQIPDEADKMILDANADIKKAFIERHL